MKKIYADEKWCLGCRLCEYYCAYSSLKLSRIEELKDIEIVSNIKVQDNGKVTFAVNCRQCDNPLCVKSCITGALSKGNDGIVVIDKDKCVGCYTCVLTCPYGAIVPSKSGVAQKCQLCTDNGRDKPLCVEKCPNNAIKFVEEV